MDSQFDQETQTRIQRARAAGVPEDQIQREATTYQQQKSAANPQPQPDSSSSWADWLPVAGGIAGTFLPIPGVGTVAGAAIGGALGAGLGTVGKQVIKKEPPNLPEIATESAIGGAGGLLGEGLNAGFKGITKLAGKGAGELEDAAALKVLRPSKTQIYKFNKTTGESLEDFITRNQLYSKGPGQVEDLITPLQGNYDSALTSQNNILKPTQVYTPFESKVKELKGSTNTDLKRLGGQLEQELNNVKAKYGNTPIQTADILNERRQIDSLLTPGSFAQDPVQAGKNKIVRDIYKQVLDESSGGATKEMGSELNKLYAYRDLAELQDGLGKGNLPVGLMQVLGATTGGAIGGSTGDPGNALKGALAGAGFVYLANNPKAIALAIKALQRAKSGLPEINLDVAGRVAGQGAAQGVGALLPSIGGMPEKQPQVGSGAATGASSRQGGQSSSLQTGSGNQGQSGSSYTNSIVQSGSKVNTMGQDTATGYTVQQLGQAATKALMAGDKASYAQLKQLYDLEAGYQKQLGTGGKKPVTEAQAARDQMAYLINDAVTQLDSNPSIKTGPFAPQLEETKSIFNKGDQATIDFYRTVAGLKAAIAKARAGTSFTPNEEKLLNQYAPVEGDSMQQLRSKLNGLKKLATQMSSTEITSPTQVNQSDYSSLPPIQ